MRFRELLLEGRDAPLYHGINKMQWALLALQDDRLAATSVQRFWDDGKRRKDNDPEYEGSYWMKGISTTRDVKYAMAWGSVVFKLNQSWLAQRYKITPFNWGYSIPSPNHHKREREEFIVVKATKDRYERSEEDGGGFDQKRFQSPEGYVGPLSQFLDGLYLHTWHIFDDGAERIIEHPKFLGYYQSSRSEPTVLYPKDSDREQFRDAWKKVA